MQALRIAIGIYDSELAPQVKGNKTPREACRLLRRKALCRRRQCHSS